MFHLAYCQFCLGDAVLRFSKRGVYSSLYLVTDVILGPHLWNWCTHGVRKTNGVRMVYAKQMVYAWCTHGVSVVYAWCTPRVGYWMLGTESTGPNIFKYRVPIKKITRTGTEIEKSHLCEVSGAAKHVVIVHCHRGHIRHRSTAISSYIVTNCGVCSM